VLIMRTPRQLVGDLRAMLRRLGGLFRFVATGRLDVSELAVSDAEGREHVRLAAGASGGCLAVFDTAGCCRAWVQMTHLGPSIALRDQRGTLRALLEATEKLQTDELFTTEEVSFTLADERNVVRTGILLGREDTVFMLNGRLVFREPIDPASQPETKEPV